MRVLAAERERKGERICVQTLDILYIFIPPGFSVYFRQIVQEE